MDDDYVLLGRSSDEDWSRGDGGSNCSGASDGGRPAPAGGSTSGLRMPTSWAAPPLDGGGGGGGGGPSSLQAPTTPHVSGSRPPSPVHDTPRNRLSGIKEKDGCPTPAALLPSSPATFRITIPPSTPPRSRSPSLRHESGSFVIAGIEYLQALEPSDLWLMLYFCAAAALPIYNKALLRGFFPFPWILTANQMACSSLGTIAAAKFGVYRVSRLSTDRETVLYAASLLFSCEILASNVSLKLVAVPYHLSVRALAPVITLILSVLFFKQRTTARTASYLLLVALGVAFTSHGLDFHSTGSILTIFSMLLASAKALITRELLLERYQLHPFDLQSRMTTLGVAHCVLFAWWNGELRRLWDAGADMSKNHLVAILGNGVLSFALFVIALLAEKRTNSDSMAISAHAAQAFTTATAVLVFGLKLTPTNFIGVALTLGGGVLYARSDAHDMVPSEKVPGGPSGKALPD